MEYDKRGRLAKSVDDAEGFIRHFICACKDHADERWVGRSFDYDLFLPRLLEIVENLPVDEGVEPTTNQALERLYMEAAWELCRDGLLRPGPRQANFDNSRDAYGKGYSLTFRGEAWLKGSAHCG